MMKTRIGYNWIWLGLLAGITCCFLYACNKAPAHKVIVIGVDGMDYKLTRQWIDNGLLPNLEALADEGGFSALGTSIPPESPVAWSNFITGMNPGGHGVFDFLHRSWEGESFLPCDSIAGTEPVTNSITLFGYELPLAGGDSFNKRKGVAFWELLEAQGIPASIFKIPANFPPSPTGQKTLSGMGTPDVQGGYGTYYVYTDSDDYLLSKKDFTGEIIPITIIDNTIKDFIYGPENIAIAGDEKPKTTIPFTIYIDPIDPVVKLVAGDESSDPREIILKEGEWSEFVDVDFEIIPFLSSVSGIARFYLKSVRPDFVLFTDPININPKSPVPDISTPPEWAPELAERNGYFYTKGMPEDTKALEEGILTYDEMREQSMLIYQKRKEMLFDLLEHHDSGLLFYYFCSIDLDSHMFWRCMDFAHPGHNKEEGNENFIKWLYSDLDRTLGEVRKKLGKDDTLIIMSDHGFAPYYRSINLNTWLLNNGYASLKEGVDRGGNGYTAVDWSKTRAYNLGFACIYLNVKGKDPYGIVDPEDVKDLTDEICSKLMKLKDPENNEPVFLRMYKTREVYSGEALNEAPEIIVGCKARYRVSNDSALGSYPPEEIYDNMDAWSGCHLMAAEEVPGILFSNRKIRLQ
ncbi:MAG: alkaline phosphatase family protein, partial [Planctomycetota bacterium]